MGSWRENNIGTKLGCMAVYAPCNRACCDDFGAGDVGADARPLSPFKIAIG